MTQSIRFLTTLWLGSLGFSSAAQNAIVTSAGETRLAWAPEDGCVPGASHTYFCPLKMDCFPHKAFPKGGYCDCNPLFINTPAKLPFDDSEWDDGFYPNDCSSWSFVKFILGAFHLYCVIWSLAFVHTNCLVTLELFRTKALKWNATAMALMYSLYGALSMSACFLIYFLNTWDLEPEYWYNRRGLIFLYGSNWALMTCDTEIGCTWIDLVDRTRKMSKSTSKSLTFLRWFVRFTGLGITAYVFYGIYTGTIGGLLNSAVIPSAVSAVFIGLAGFLIIRTICPNGSDISNPNWKVAKSIERTTKYAILGKFIEILALFGMLNTGKRATLSYAYGFFNPLWFWGYQFRQWSYLSYIIVGNRKHLKKYESENVSGFFGFSTVGLNKTITRASSAFTSYRATTAAPTTFEKD
ncbi:hypothetical protein HJC23_000433 [Cyclotella cryptica]|uniref:Uncharacterized protein n=1 Tax=Cyclotella cryptica TaxID=29204 RepID=A0ABD3QAD0_9STRA